MGFVDDFFTDKLGPFSRLVIVLALILGFGTNLRSLLYAPDTGERYKKTEANERWRDHGEKHERDRLSSARENAIIEADIVSLQNAINLHMQSSERYREKIERVERYLESRGCSQ